MKKVTITLDEKTAACVRVCAAKHGKSVSRLVGEMLAERMHDRREYDAAMRRFFSTPPFKFEWIDGHRPTREELYERRRLR